MAWPRILEIKWYADGFGYQVVNLGRKEGVALGCVKVWWITPAAERICIDRALTVSSARRMIMRYRAMGPLWLHQKLKAERRI